MAGESTGNSSDGTNASTSNSPSPVAARTPSKRLRVAGRDSVNNAPPPDACESRPPVPSRSAKSVHICSRFCPYNWDQT